MVPISLLRLLTTYASVMFRLLQKENIVGVQRSGMVIFKNWKSEYVKQAA